jgi:hypothetical protein
MPSNRQHSAFSYHRTGKSYSDLHSWIDRDDTGLGCNHRKKKHCWTENYEDYVYENFGGDEAVSEWLLHIALDNLSTAWKLGRKTSKKHHNFFMFGFEKESNYVFYDFESIGEKEMMRRFKKSYESE